MDKWLDKEIPIQLDFLLMIAFLELHEIVYDFDLPSWMGGLFIISFFFLLIRAWINLFKPIQKKDISNHKLEGE